ncbi:MAG: ribonuclease Y [Desulfobacterota bacterium]|nr:ribonuclease Y [Thermodesulfobacteriota bacterium]
MDTLITIVLLLLCFGLGLGIGFLLRKKIIEQKISSAEEITKKIISDAQKEAETLRKEAKLQAKEELYRAKAEFEKETRNKKIELQKLEKRLSQKEENIEKKASLIDQKELLIAKREKAVASQEKMVKEMEERYGQLLEEQKKLLEKISGMTSEEAKKLLMQSLENEAKHESARTIRRIEEETKENADKLARNIIAMAIQRYSADYVAEKTVSVVALPNDEMKGRIIGREGRNIRSIEQITGVDLIIDDTPETILISSFDPIRREIARIALERLIADGRIHPSRIEEIVEKVRQEMETTIREAGEQAIFDIGIQKINPEIVRLLGRLKYRTSYDQNVLQHSLEVAYLCGLMAGELGLNIKTAKRAGLLHDIGKAVDHEVEGSHAIIGADLAKKYGEPEEIIHAIAAHHDDVKAQTVLAVLVQASDALSAARPGARREMLGTYIKHLKDLEDIANSFKGVSKSYAVQAGREIRVMVESSEVSDDDAVVLSKDISKKIEESLTYPGQIKITVIRETRAVEYAK